jgi:TPR repeat protein
MRTALAAAALIAVIFATAPAGAARAADVGGWMEHKNRTERAAKDDCAAVVALAARTEQAAEGAAAAYYAAGLCYLHGEPSARGPSIAQSAAQGTDAGADRTAEEPAREPKAARFARDPVAAQAWLARAAELEHPLARRALLALREASAGNETHAPGWHCHDLGLGRRICHGGASPAY